MAVYAVVRGRREAKPHTPALYRALFGAAKLFNHMSIAGALRSKNAEEFKLPASAGENNWKSRLTFASTLAEAIGDNPSSAPANFAATMEPYYTNLMDGVISERTTLSNACCRLVGLLPRVMGKEFVPLLDRFVPVLIHQCASTKTIAQKSASAAMTNIINFSPFHLRTLHHVCQTFENKYSAPKLYAPGWLQLIIENYYPALNPDRDYELISKTIATGLCEADNNVRVNTRATFWAYHKIDPAGADHIMNEVLRGAAKTALLNDPNNPDKAQNKGKTQPESNATLAQVRQRGKERIQQKISEREQKVADEYRRICAQSDTAQDFIVGSLNMGDMDKLLALPNEPWNMAAPNKTQSIAIPTKTQSITIPTKTQNIAIPTKAHTTVAPLPDNKPTVIKTTSRPIAIHKKANSDDRGRQAAPSATSISDPPNARPFLSAPVRRPRIIATPIAIPQSSSRPGSRTGNAHAGIRQIGTTTNDVITEDLSSKDNKLSTAPSKPPTRRLDVSTTTSGNTGSSQWEDVSTQSDYSYSNIDTNITIKEARTALAKALELLINNKLDSFGFRKLRKLFDTYPQGLIIDREVYRLLFDLLLPKLGAIEELLFQPDPTETNFEGNPRFIRQAVLTIIMTLVTQYSMEWSQEFQGRLIAAMMVARCAYSANYWFHQGAPYIHNLTIVNTLYANLEVLSQHLTEPLSVLDSVLNTLDAGEELLLNHAEYDSEIQKSGSFASFNPYSINARIKNRLTDHAVAQAELTEMGMNTSDSYNIDPLADIDTQPLPTKLVILMEMGLRVIKSILTRIAYMDHLLGPDREIILSNLVRHLMQTYGIIIRKEVVAFLRLFHDLSASSERFFQLFPDEGERNLVHYYLEM